MTSTAVPSASSIIELLLRNRYCDVAVLHSAVVISLEEDRAGLRFIAVERSSGNAGQFLVVVNLHTIPENGDMPADECDSKVCHSPAFSGITVAAREYP